MSDGQRISTEALTPILYVRDFPEAMHYYTEKLLMTDPLSTRASF